MHQTDYDWSKLIAPVALVLALGGLGFILLLTVALSFMYGIKILWEGNRKKKHPYVPRNVKIYMPRAKISYGMNPNLKRTFGL
ncbi:MAG: hypothetical protein MK132_22745 [Lentisphaerales bacterium]|nr:hypothetical protein [Lentisphaerales bacterium]